MLEALAALLLMSVLSDQGRANDQVQKAVKEALRTKRGECAFYVLVWRPLLNEAIMISNLIKGDRPGHEPGGGYTSSEAALNDLEMLFRMGHDPIVAHAAAQHTLNELMGAADYIEWNQRISVRVEAWDTWMEDEEIYDNISDIAEVPGLNMMLLGDGYYTGVIIYLSPPPPMEVNETKWFSDFSDEIADVEPMWSDIIDIVYFDPTGQRDPREPLISPEENIQIEARELLDKPLIPDQNNKKEYHLFHRDLWDQIVEKARGRLIKSVHFE